MQSDCFQAATTLLRTPELRIKWFRVPGADPASRVNVRVFVDEWIAGQLDPPGDDTPWLCPAHRGRVEDGACAHFAKGW